MENKMAAAPVGKLIRQMTIPPLISMFLQYSYNLIDSAFVARLSSFFLYLKSDTRERPKS